MTKDQIIDDIIASHRTCVIALDSFKQSGDPHNLTEWMEGRRDALCGVLNSIALDGDKIDL